MEENKYDIKKFRIPLRKKFWYSITKFERYPEMAAEGVGRAIKYLLWLMLMFGIIIAIGLMIKFSMIAKEGIKYIDENFTEINYEGGKLSIQSVQNEYNTDFGRVIINTTDDITADKMQEYENSLSRKLQFIWLKDRVIAKYSENSFEIYYKDVLEDIGLQQFNKLQLVELLNNKMSNPKTYILYGIATIIYIFIGYFIAVLLDVLILSFFGWITTLIAQIKMRYRAVFNMSVYSITISTILQCIYILIRTFTDFNIKYFDLMYTTISFICLAAAIFMIRSDVIKQQLELMRIIEIKRQQEEQNQNKEEEKPEEKEEKPDEEKEKEETQNKEEHKKRNVNGDIEGSNA